MNIRRLASGLIVGLAMVSATGIAAADPKIDANSQKIRDSGIAVATSPPENSNGTLNAAVMACNELLSNLEADLPQANQAGSNCDDPNNKKATLYLAGTVSADQAPAVITRAAQAGYTLTVIPVTHSKAELLTVANNPANWTAQAKERLWPSLLGTTFNATTNSVQLLTDENATWTEQEASDLLGVRVTKQISSPIMSADR